MIETVEPTYVDTFAVRAKEKRFVFKLLGQETEYYIALDHPKASHWMRQILQCYRERLDTAFLLNDDQVDIFKVENEEAPTALHYYFNSSEEHFSTLTLHYKIANQTHQIHLQDAIWFACNTTEEPLHNQPKISTQADSALKKSHHPIIKLCSLDYDAVNHITIHLGNQVVQALASGVRETNQDSNTNAFNSFKNAQKLPVEAVSGPLLPTYKNYGQTEVTFSYFPEHHHLLVNGNFYNAVDSKTEKVRLLFEQVQGILHNPVHTVDQKYDADILYLSQNNEDKTFTFFSALRDPIEVTAQAVFQLKN